MALLKIYIYIYYYGISIHARLQQTNLIYVRIIDLVSNVRRWRHHTSISLSIGGPYSHPAGCSGSPRQSSSGPSRVPRSHTAAWSPPGDRAREHSRPPSGAPRTADDWCISPARWPCNSPPPTGPRTPLGAPSGYRSRRQGSPGPPGRIRLLQGGSCTVSWLCEWGSCPGGGS